MAHLTGWLRSAKTRLAIWFHSGQAWSVNANWFPLLFLALLWMLAEWCHLNLFPSTVLPTTWSLCALGSAAYLLTLAGFFFFGNHDRSVDASTRTATALAVGAATIFAIYAWDKWPEGTKPTGAMPISADVAKPDGNNPLDSINVFAAILGAVLAGVALIAQKSATDAKAEAERARKDILEALDIRAVALSSRLLERAQAAKSEAEELLTKANEMATRDQSIARFLSLGTSSLGRLARFFMLLHHSILDPYLTPASDLVGNATILILDLQALNRAAQAAEKSARDQEIRLRIKYWQPAGRLIESLLILGLPRSTVPTEAEKVMLKLQEVRAMLNQL